MAHRKGLIIKGLRSRIARAMLAAIVVAAALPASSGAAQTPSPLWQAPEDGKAGAGAGRLFNDRSIAGDPTTGHVYVADAGNNRIDEFTSWGGFVKAFGWGVADGTSEELQTCSATCFRGLKGPGAGQFGFPHGIAVDPNGDLYVFEGGAFLGESFSRVQKLDPTAGLEGSEAKFIWMIGGDVDKTKVEEAGSSEAERNLCTAASGDVCQAATDGTGKGQFSVKTTFGVLGNYIATSPGGNIYVADKGGEDGTRARIQTFAPNGEFESQFTLPASGYTGEFGPDNPGALAVDPKSGDLYFAFNQVEGARQPNVYKLSPAGALLGKLEVAQPEALATDAAGDLYVIDGPYEEHNYQEVVEFDSSGKPLIPVGTKFDRRPESSTLTLEGLGTNVIAPGSKTPGDLYVSSIDNLGAGPAKKEVSAVTAYGPPEEFELPPKVPPAIEDQFATSVDPEGAVVKGKINPNFWKDTTYYVEYGTGKCSEGGCAFQQPAAPGVTLTSKLVRESLGASVFLTALTPHTTYHYRFVAQSGGSEGEPVRGLGGKVGADGAEASFTTSPLPAAPPNPDPCPNAQFRSGAAALLPDCRAYEMVSPLDKNNGDIVALLAGSGISFPARFDESAAGGEALTFSSYRAFGGAESASWSTQYLARRGPGGWATEAISPPRSGSSLPGFSFSAELDTIFRAFSPDLQSAWLDDPYAPTPDPAVPGTFTNIFRRDNQSGAYQAQIRAVPPHFAAGDSLNHYPDLQGVTADGTHAVFTISDNLTPEAPELGQGVDQLYEAYSEGGEAPNLRLVSALPNGEPAKTGAAAGIANEDPGVAQGRTANVDHAISADGTRIYWTAATFGPGKIYLRLNGTQTRPVSEAVSASPARFWAASADGSSALYSFTAGSKAGDLYRYNQEKGKSSLIAHKALGFLAAAEDLSRIYFASEEALAAGATAGKPNLYLDQEGTFTYIGPLSAADANAGGENNVGGENDSPVNVRPVYHTARAGADGGALAFMSNSPALAAAAGYDNTDQASGKADEEVYRYDAASNQLACVSCNPTGARPLGRLFDNVPSEFLSVASFVPTFESQLYQPRYLSDDGARLYFDSFEALLPRDTNGAEDVYQWEAPGSGDCTEAGSAFIVSSGGCLSLITSGESPRDAEFIDADATGKDVFIATLSSLLPQDPGLVDLYDAREGGGFPAPPKPPPACEGEACQGPLAPPNDPTPSSSSFEGAGNVVEKPVARKHKKKAKKHSKNKKKAAHKRAKSNRRAGR